MNSNYYTPEINEFYVGFEYEQKERSFGEWYKTKFGYNKELSEYYREIERNFIRVKKLDEQDILDCAFILTERITEQKVYFRDSEYKIGITFRKNFYEGFSNIHIYEFRKPLLTLFQGKIKNKTELKKILNQVNVTEPYTN